MLKLAKVRVSSVSVPPERLRVEDDVAWPRQRQQRRGDGRHAGGEEDACLGALVDGQPVLDDLAVGMIEAGIDEARAAGGGFLAAADDVEEVAALLRRPEDEGRGEKHRRLDRSFREHRVETVGEHQRLRMQAMIADMGLGGARSGHGRYSLKNGCKEQERPSRRPDCSEAFGYLGSRGGHFCAP